MREPILPAVGISRYERHGKAFVKLLTEEGVLDIPVELFQEVDREVEKLGLADSDRVTFELVENADGEQSLRVRGYEETES